MTAIAKNALKCEIDALKDAVNFYKIVSFDTPQLCNQKSWLSVKFLHLTSYVELLCDIVTVTSGLMGFSRKHLVPPPQHPDNNFFFQFTKTIKLVLFLNFRYYLINFSRTTGPIDFIIFLYGFYILTNCYSIIFINLNY